MQIFVEREEAEAQKMAGETRAIAEDAQRDLAEALPALDAAVACLNKLKKSDIDEVCSGCNCQGLSPFSGTVANLLRTLVFTCLLLSCALSSSRAHFL